MKILFALLCDHAHSREDGRMDIHGVFQQLYAPGFPARQEALTLVTAVDWEEGEEGKQEFRIDMVDPTGSPALTISGHTDVSVPDETGVPPQTRLLMPLERVVFPRAGRYEFVLHRGEESWPLTRLYLIEDPQAG